MSLVIPAADLQSTQLNGVITAITAEITAAGSNGQLAAFHTAAKAQAQSNLILHLLGVGKLTAASIISNCTYNT